MKPEYSWVRGLGLGLGLSVRLGGEEFDSVGI